MNTIVTQPMQGQINAVNGGPPVKIYSMADFFVNPSVEETFGLTGYEASLCGTPVIVYEDTACEEIAKLYGGYVVKRGTRYIYDEIVKHCNHEKY